MRILKIILFLIMLNQWLDVSAFSGVVYFKNEDKVHGCLESASPGEGVLLKLDNGIGETVSFNWGAIARIERKKSDGVLCWKSKGTVELVLDNGDLLKGDLLSIKGSVCELKLPYSEVVKIPVGRIRGMDIYNSDYIIHDGFSNDWILFTYGIRKREVPVIEDGVLKLKNSRSGALRKDILPRRFRLDFEIFGRGNLDVILFADKEEYEKGSYYSLSVSSEKDEISLSRGDEENGEDKQGAELEVEFDFSKNEYFKFNILVDSLQKKLIVFYHGRLVGEWGLDKKFVKGRNLLFFLDDCRRELQIKNLNLSVWDGETMPVNLDGNSIAQNILKNDILVLENGDKLTGNIESIEKNILKFKTAYAPVEMPMNKIKKIFFSQKKSDVKNEKDKEKNKFMNFSSLNGDKITLDVKEIKDGKVYGANPVVGAMELKLKYLKTIYFNEF